MTRTSSDDAQLKIGIVTLIAFTTNRCVLVWWWCGDIWRCCDNRLEINELENEDKGGDSISPPLLIWWSRREANRLFSRRVADHWWYRMVVLYGGPVSCGMVWYGMVLSCGMVVRKRDKSIGFDELSPHLVIKPSKSWHINSLSQRTKGFQFTQTWDDENANGGAFQYFRFVVFFKVYICVWWSFLDWVGGWGGWKPCLWSDWLDQIRKCCQQ